MEPTDITIQILTSIRDELTGLNDRVDGLNDRVDGLNDRVDGLGERVEGLHRRQVETETRLSTELLAVVGAIHEVRDVLIGQGDLRPTVQDHERRLARLKAQVG